MYSNLAFVGAAVRIDDQRQILHAPNHITSLQIAEDTPFAGRRVGIGRPCLIDHHRVTEKRCVRRSRRDALGCRVERRSGIVVQNPFDHCHGGVEEITTTSGEPPRWPTVDDTGNVGVIAAQGTAPASGGADLVFGEETPGEFKYVAPGAGQLPLRVSVELLQDSTFDIQGLWNASLVRVSVVLRLHWVTGNGTTETFGIVPSAIRRDISQLNF